ncbi:MAG: hypothetical protein IK017_11885 [Paludibacteraceae bacterium]|nr:hypothetical protein [Paludibacteraceae bacterium]MBR5973333.1 hypothetical protein [Paludibacteraceae bacterium]
MYNFSFIESVYEFNTCITFANGQKSSFRKLEHIQAEEGKDGYAFTMKGSSNETLDDKEPEDWDAIVLEFGKALYPIGLRVSGQGEFVGLRDFEGIKEHWKARRQEIIDYYNSYLIEKESNRYALALKTEDKFYHILKENMFYRLFLWQESLQNQKVEIRDFPTRARLAIFSFHEKKYDKTGGIIYDTYDVTDEGSGQLLSGHAKLHLRRDKDGLPGEISLWARVEEKDAGFFTKEITIKRI